MCLSRLTGLVLAVVLVAPTLAERPTAQAGAPAVAAFDLDEITIAELQQRMASGRETSRSIVQKYLARIGEVDQAGPALHSVIEVNPDALAMAEALDAERKAGRVRGPLHGIPVLLKDNIATGDRMLTTAGSLVLAGAPAPKDSAVAAKLRTAGAVILGKTNLSEWANFRSSHSSSGWSARGGLTKNPYALDRNTSGSSSGSGAATAANLCAAAIGTETDGSIVSPANNNGVVGIKPTVGLVSRTGIVPISHTQDTAGPMARTVADAVAVLAAISGTDNADAATQPASRHPMGDLTSSFRPDALQGARIGIVRNKLFGYSPAADRVAEAAIAVMKTQGAIIVDPADIPTLGTFDESEMQVLLYEFKADLAGYFAWLGPTSPVHTLADVIAFNDAHRDREMPWFGQELMLQAEKTDGLTSPKYLAALAKNRQAAGARGIDAVMDTYKLDALVAPTGAPAWLTDLVNGDSVAGSASTVAAVAGYPHITVPAGFDHGLPIGVSFIGRAWSEPTLVGLAYSYEQASHARRPPTFAASIH